MDAGYINRQFRLIHSNCYLLRAHSANGLANILEAKLRKEFSRKITVDIIRARKEKQMVNSTHVPIHDIELEVKNVPVNYGSEVRSAIRALRLCSKPVTIHRELGFH